MELKLQLQSVTAQRGCGSAWRLRFFSFSATTERTQLDGQLVQIQSVTGEARTNQQRKPVSCTSLCSAADLGDPGSGLTSPPGSSCDADDGG